MADAFVTLISVQPSQSGLSSKGDKFQNRPQSAGAAPSSLYEARRDGGILRAQQASGRAVTTVSPAQRPPDILNLTAESRPAPSHAVRITWDGQPDVIVVQYRIYYSTSPFFDSNTWPSVTLDKPSAALMRPFFDVTGLEGGTTYYFAMRGENQYGVGPTTPTPISATTPLDPPLPPKDLVVMRTGYNTAPMWWRASDGATSYAIYFSSSPGVTKTNSTRLVTTQNPTLVPYPGGGPFFARVAGIGLGGEGELSEETFTNIATL